MPYQLSYADRYSATAAPTAYAVVTSCNIDMLAPSAVYNISVWRSKADRTAGAQPISTFSRAISGAGLAAIITSIGTLADNAVTAAQVPELPGASVVA